MCINNMIKLSTKGKMGDLGIVRFWRENVLYSLCASFFYRCVLIENLIYAVVLFDVVSSK